MKPDTNRMHASPQSVYRNALIIVSCTIVAAVSVVTVDCLLQQDSRTTGAVSARLQKAPQRPTNITKCGTKYDLIHRVDVCVSPLMNILQGTIKKWPRNEADARDLCNDFGYSERCIRDNARTCAKGIHKTIISTLANSVHRVRKRECSNDKLISIVKMTTCVEKNLQQVKTVIANITSRLSVIENKMPTPEHKINGICCVAAQVEPELKVLFDRVKCPAEGELVIRLYKSIVEDVLELICRQPKCNNIFAGYKIERRNDFDGLIPIILRIIFTLG